MKKFFATILFFSCIAEGQCQDTVEVSFLYETTLLFKDTVKRVRPGSHRAVITEASSNNTVSLKANGEILMSNNLDNIPNTNIVILAGSTYYNVIAKYVKYPNRLTYFDHEFKSGVSLTKENEKPKTNYRLKGLALRKRKIFTVSSKRDHMEIFVANIWVGEGKFYIHLWIENSSNIPFDIDYKRITVTSGKRGGKRSSVVEKDLQVVEELAQSKSITKSWVNIIVLEKFVLNDRERLSIQYGENNGRQATVNIPRAILFKASRL